jgi:hypothetical protein
MLKKGVDFLEIVNSANLPRAYVRNFSRLWRHENRLMHATISDAKRERKPEAAI